MKTEHPTPRTDAAQFGTGRVSVSFAQSLERELAQTKAIAAELAESAEELIKTWHEPIGMTPTLERLNKARRALAKWKEGTKGTK